MSIKNSLQKGRILRGNLLLIGVICTFLIAPSVHADNEYRFVNATGDIVTLPTDLPIHTLDAPGPMVSQPNALEPKISTWIRKDGLEDIRVLLIKVKNPFTEGEPELPAQALYVIDKDGLVLGYRKFEDNTETEISEKFTVNGIINHLDVYVEYTNLGLWKKELHFEFQ